MKLEDVKTLKLCKGINSDNNTDYFKYILKH